MTWTKGELKMDDIKQTEQKVIVFRLKDEEYALSVDRVGGIEKLTSITRVPQTADFVKGVINLRGVVTPIIDLRIRFGIEEMQHTESTRIIIVYHNGAEVGLIVDAANDVIDIPIQAIEPTPEVVGAVHVDYIEGIAKLDKRLLILLDLEKVLKTGELNTLSKSEE